ncbi:MAG: hypothetical protein BroJett022_14850 [Actinomycetes bacterium]|nr:MAG: hypothetical protein BroJett022_14850 [Actinomycetes bacterium]
MDGRLDSRAKPENFAIPKQVASARARPDLRPPLTAGQARGSGAVPAARADGGDARSRAGGDARSRAGGDARARADGGDARATRAGGDEPAPAMGTRAGADGCEG